MISVGDILTALLMAVPVLAVALPVGSMLGRRRSRRARRLMIEHIRDIEVRSYHGETPIRP